MSASLLPLDTMRTASGCRHAPLDQRNAGDVIDTRLHRCAPIHQPPLPDDAHDWRLEQAEEDEHIERLHAIADRVVYVIFVLALLVVVFDRYWMLLPGVGQ